MSAASSLLSIHRLSVRYQNGAQALRNVSLTVNAGERIAIIGESGCGKTTLVRTLLGLLPRSATVDGNVLLDGATSLTGVSDRTLRQIRGRMIGYVPQNPQSAFDPLRSVGSQIAEAWLCHGRSISREELLDALAAVGIDDAPKLINSRPSAWSGGMLQRASILSATALRPQLVLADEPTSAVDRPLARRMLALLAERAGSLLVVTHDVDLVDGAVDRVLVMYAGRVVEDAPAAAFFARQQHPYARALLQALPRPGVLPAELPGDPPRLDRLEPGCAFAPRCPLVGPACAVEPELLCGVACHAVQGLP